MNVPSNIAADPRASLDALVREHQAMVWRYLRFLGCPPAEADDLTQETFVRVLARPVDSFGAAGARAYLRTVAKNAFLKAVDRAGRRREVDLEAAEEAFAWYSRDDDGASARAALTLRFADLLDRAASTGRRACCRGPTRGCARASNGDCAMSGPRREREPDHALRATHAERTPHRRPRVGLLLFFAESPPAQFIYTMF